MTKVKLCGLKRLCDIEWANEVRPDYVGFVFAGKKRRVTDAIATALRQHLDQAIPAVGVFVNEEQEHIIQLVKAGVIQVVQLHGQEDDDYIEALRQTIDVPLIKAFSITGPDSLKAVETCRADYVLLDNGPGGTGEAFDWQTIQYRIHRPFFLAGGLTPENVAQAMALKPYALDVSSGIETDGVKDKQKIIKFMAQVKTYASQEGME